MITNRTRDLLRLGASLGQLRTLIALGKVKKYISEKDADHGYGSINVPKWLAADLWTSIPLGISFNTQRSDRLELELIQLAAELPDTIEGHNPTF